MLINRIFFIVLALLIFSFLADAETFGPSLVSLVRRALWEFIALSLHCFTDGAQGLERVIQERVVSNSAIG